MSSWEDTVIKEDTLRQIRPRLAILFALLAVALCPASGLAQGADSFTVGLMAGLGGSAENEPDTGFDNLGWQALFTMKLDNSTVWGVRAGVLKLDADGEDLDSDLTYLTLSGEYLYVEGGFQTGLYLGLGFYDLSGGDALGDDTSLGLVLGITGHVPVSERLSVLLELSGHYAALDQTQFLLMGHVGVGYHF